MTVSRRTFLRSSALVAGAALSTRVVGAAPPAEAITPALIEAARREGKLAFYTAMDLPVAERFAKAFEAKFSGIAVRVERSGAERVFQRIGQEYTSNIRVVDVVNTADGAHMIVWKRNGWLGAYVPEDVARHFPAQYHDPDGMSALTRVWLSSLGYNTNLVKAEDAPKSFADLLDPKWMGKMVKGHPGYSGAILTATFVLARDLGWPYLEKLAQQKVMQVQSAADPPKKILLGERAVMADGNDYNLVLLKDQGKPVEVVYPAEGSPLIIVPSGIFRSAPNPNAARLFQSFFFSAETQQMLVDVFAHRSFHGQVKEKGEHVPLSTLKLLKADPAQVQAQSEEIKARYTKIFGV